METFDSPGKVSPIGTADQGIVSKKISDKDGQRQAAQGRQKRPTAPSESTEEGAVPRTGSHIIDIVV